MELAQDGEVYFAIRIYPVAFLATPRFRYRTIDPYLERTSVGIERNSQFGTFTAHGDVQTVVGMNHRFILGVIRVALSHLHVLQIDELLRRPARRKQKRHSPYN